MLFCRTRVIADKPRVQLPALPRLLLSIFLSASLFSLDRDILSVCVCLDSRVAYYQQFLFYQLLLLVVLCWEIIPFLSTDFLHFSPSGSMAAKTGSTTWFITSFSVVWKSLTFFLTVFEDLNYCLLFVCGLSFFLSFSSFTFFAYDSI